MRHQGWKSIFLFSAYLLSWETKQAYAQTPQNPAADASGIEEIVVTAQKRAEKTQDVPVSIAAFSSRDLEKTGINTALGLNQLVSGLNIGLGGAGALTPFLRGIGNNSFTAGNEASTAIYVDDVYIPRLPGSFFELNGIDRVEVLKGPQGTLFGRNASGGLINIITKTPSLDDYDIEASVGYGNYDTTTQKLYLSAPITDTLAGNISVYHKNQGEGWGRNFFTNSPWGYEDPTVLRSKWLFTPSEDLKITAAADYSHSKTTVGINANQYPGTVNGIPAFLTLPPFNLPEQEYFPVGYYDSNVSVEQRNREEIYGGYVRADYNAGFAKLSSISSLRQENESFYSDSEYVPLNQLQYSLITHTRAASEEIQIASEKNSSFDWIVGLYYLNEFAGYEPVQITGQGVAAQILQEPSPAVLPLGSRVNIFGQQRIEDYATYGQATFHVSDNTNITLGARYTVDHLHGRGSTDLAITGLPVLTFPGSQDVSTTFYKPTYKVALDHHFTDDLMSYISVSRGFKAGTYNILPLSPPAASPEVVDAYEAGVKSVWFNRSLQLNGAFFYYHIKDPQVQEVANHLTFYANANAAEVKGVDIDGQYAVLPNLLARFGAEYLDPHYTSFTNAPFFGPVFFPPYGATAAISGNASGNLLVDAPRITFNLGLNYALSTEFGDFNFNTTAYYNGGFRWQPDNFQRQRAYALLDASVIFEPAGYDNWEVKLWGKNLTGTRYATSATEQAGNSGYSYTPAAPCTFGAELTYRFSTPRNPEPEAAPPAPTPVQEPAAPPPAAAAPAPEAQRAYQVFFDFDKSAITPAAAAVLQEAAASIKAGNHVKVLVTGHTDTVGSVRYNQRLSERRAAAVKAQLISDGVMSDDIATRGVGKTDLLVPTPYGVREPQNRRAEIVEQDSGA